jgi:hypothetical protein
VGLVPLLRLARFGAARRRRPAETGQHPDEPDPARARGRPLGLFMDRDYPPTACRQGHLPTLTARHTDTTRPAGVSGSITMRSLLLLRACDGSPRARPAAGPAQRGIPERGSGGPCTCSATRGGGSTGPGVTAYTVPSFCVGLPADPVAHPRIVGTAQVDGSRRRSWRSSGRATRRRSGFGCGSTPTGWSAGLRCAPPGISWTSLRRLRRPPGDPGPVADPPDPTPPGPPLCRCSPEPHVAARCAWPASPSRGRTVAEDRHAWVAPLDDGVLAPGCRARQVNSPTSATLAAMRDPGQVRGQTGMPATRSSGAVRARSWPSSGATTTRPASSSAPREGWRVRR